MTTEYKTIADAMKVEEKLKSPGVPLSECGGDGILQPLIKHKFLIHFTGPLGECYLIPKSVLSCSRPTPEFEETKTAIGADNHIFTAGKHTWLPQKISFTDKVDSTAAKFIHQQLQIQNEAFMGGEPIEYMFNVNIAMLDPDEHIVEAWDMTNCFLQEVTYPSISTSDDVDMELTIRCDYAQML